MLPDENPLFCSSLRAPRFFNGTTPDAVSIPLRPSIIKFIHLQYMTIKRDENVVSCVIQSFIMKYDQKGKS
jgi:hypothetical protein